VETLVARIQYFIYKVEIKFSSRALRIASTRFLDSNFLKSAATWLLIVASELKRIDALSRAVKPLLIKDKTSISLFVSGERIASSRGSDGA
jgi:hypothetical protein